MIVVKPHIIEPVAVGDTIFLTCVASGDPLPSFQWYKGGVPLMNESTSTIYTEEYESNNLTLSILALCSTAVNDSGTYSCQATNFVGNASFEFEILVLEGILYYSYLVCTCMTLYNVVECTCVCVCMYVCAYTCVYVNIIMACSCVSTQM